MSRFRLFGRPEAPAAAAPPRIIGPSRRGAPAPWGPSPALFGGSAAPPRAAGDTDTDPHGFAPVAPSVRPAAFPQFPTAERRRASRSAEVADPFDAPTSVTARPSATPLLPRAGGAAVEAAGSATVLPLFTPGERAAPAPVPFDTSPEPAPDAAEAASLAAAFAADYLSWDEDDPGRRGRVLVDYLAAPGTDPTHLGWPGRGRQRAEFAIPGRVRADGDGRTLVDVRVRVTPYRRTGAAAGATIPEWAEAPETAGIPAVAPAPQAAGWAALGSYWIRLSVPVVRSGGRLAVDAWEENLGEELEEPRARAAEAADTAAGTAAGTAADDPEVGPSLADDAVAQPRGGTW